MTKEKNLFNYEFTGHGLSTSEKRAGEKLFNDYLEVYPHLHKLGDLQLLEELVYLEALQERYKTKAKNLSKNKKVDDAEAVSSPLQKQMKENLEQILTLKRELKMFESKETLDAYNYIKELFDKFAIWRKKNQGSRQVTCPFCSKMFFLMIRTDKYEAKKFPFFKDKILCNKELHKTWKEGCITKERYAKIMGVSQDYIDWLDEKWFQKEFESPQDK